MDPVCARAFARAPIYDLIFACLSPRSLVQITLTCRTIYFAAANFKSRAFNINRHFSRYFSDPVVFRSLQAKTNSLVSGSNALQFFDRTFYPESDLDLYTHPGHSFEIATFLVETEGYHYVPRETQNPDWRVAIDDDWDGTQTPPALDIEEMYTLKAISGVWSFEKTNVKQECLKIQIIEAYSCPMHVILEFHSTCVMNFISSDAAYFLYPIATFEERGALAMPSARNSPSSINKYVQRGWRFYFLVTPEHFSNPTEPPFLLDRTRWVGDKHTWVIPLDQTNVKERPSLSPTSAPLTFDPTILNGWKLRNPKGMGVYSYECQALAMQSTILRYFYVVPDVAMRLAMWRWAYQKERHSRRHLSKEDWVWFDTDLPSLLSSLRSAES